jgi:hypothetical protein
MSKCKMTFEMRFSRLKKINSKNIIKGDLFNLIEEDTHSFSSLKKSESICCIDD